MKSLLGECSRRRFLQVATTALAGTAGGNLAAEPRGGDTRELLRRAQKSAAIAGYSISKVQRWLHERALRAIDPETGLYRADGKWNYRDTAADCYPFLCWAAFLVDRSALYGPVLRVLEAEQRLCNHVDRIPVRFDWQKKKRDTTVGYEAMVFGASEYVKDGLVAIVEALGKGPWYERMKGIEEDLWKHARVDTPFGKIPSKNLEVNGEQIQALARLFTMSGDERFIEWAERLADYYLSDPEFVPKRLRDHGCEIIGGLGLLLGVAWEAKRPKVEFYVERLARMFDEIVRRGCNEDGLMFNWLGKPDSRLSDGWGYNYVGLLCHDMVTGQNRYRPLIEKALKSLAKPVYHHYNWEGRYSIDGFADSIEGAIYLLNRIPVAEGFAWVDREMAESVVRSREPLESATLWGTMKLDSNGVRTTILHALMHTRGVLARPWRQDLRLGAAEGDDGRLVVVLTADRPWKGVLEFDVARHRLFLGFQHDWPRMNTLPEWFVVSRSSQYRVRTVDGATRVVSGQRLRDGLPVEAGPGRSVALEIRSV